MHFNEIEGSLADRKLIATELTEKMPLLLELLNNEMDQAKEIFDQQEVFVSARPESCTYHHHLTVRLE